MSNTLLSRGEVCARNGAKRRSRKSGNDLLASRGVEQAHDQRDVVANREMGQGQLAANFLVRQALCQEVKDVALPGCQLGEPYGGLFFTVLYTSEEGAALANRTCNQLPSGRAARIVPRTSTSSVSMAK